MGGRVRRARSAPLRVGTALGSAAASGNRADSGLDARRDQDVSGSRIEAVRAAASKGESEGVGRIECRWQREQLPDAIRELVLDDQRLRNEICWSVFDC